MGAHMATKKRHMSNWENTISVCKDVIIPNLHMCNNIVDRLK